MTQSLLNDEINRQIKDVFKELSQPVAVLFFGKQEDCEYCEDTRRLLEEICQLSDLFHLSVYDLEGDASLAQQYKVDKAPSTVLAALEGEKVIDLGIRFAGIPAGSEFTSLINGLVMVSNRDSGLSQATRDFLKGLTQPVFLQVFVTPT